VQVTALDKGFGFQAVMQQSAAEGTASSSSIGATPTSNSPSSTPSNSPRGAGAPSNTSPTAL